MPQPNTTKTPAPDDRLEITPELRQKKVVLRIDDEDHEVTVDQLLRVNQLEGSIRKKERDLAQHRKDLERDAELASLLRGAISNNDQAQFLQALQLAGVRPDQLAAFQSGSTNNDDLAPEPRTSTQRKSGRASAAIDDDDYDPRDERIDELSAQVRELTQYLTQDVQEKAARRQETERERRRNEVRAALDKSPEFAKLLESYNEASRDDLKQIALENFIVPAVARRVAKEPARPWGPTIIRDGLADGLETLRKMVSGIPTSRQGDEDDTNSHEFAHPSIPRPNLPYQADASGRQSSSLKPVGIFQPGRDENVLARLTAYFKSAQREQK